MGRFTFKSCFCAFYANNYIRRRGIFNFPFRFALRGLGIRLPVTIKVVMPAICHILKRTGAEIP